MNPINLGAPAQPPFQLTKKERVGKFFMAHIEAAMAIAIMPIKPKNGKALAKHSWAHCKAAVSGHRPV